MTDTPDPTDLPLSPFQPLTPPTGPINEALPPDPGPAPAPHDPGTHAPISALYTALVRTLIPALVGIVVTYLASHNIVLDDDLTNALSVLLGGLATAVYYVAVRWLEARRGWFGWLLGSPNPPTY